jgi:DNA-binding transcriptional LysR family regulator
MIDRDGEYFLVVATERNLARAALRLGVSQPALTRAVQRLEARYGLKLLERSPRGVETTDAGVLLVETLREMSLKAEQAERMLREMSAGHLGAVRIGMGVTLQSRVRAALIPRFLLDRPGATLRLDSGLTNQLIPAMEEGRYDFVVGAIPALLSSTTVPTVLLNDEMLPIVRAAHPLALAAAPTVEQVLAYPLVGTGPETTQWRWMREVAVRLGLPAPVPTLVSNSYDAILDTVLALDCVGFAPRSHASARPGLVPLPVAEFTHPRSVGLMRRRDAVLSSVAQRAVELITEAFLAG